MINNDKEQFEAKVFDSDTIDLTQYFVTIKRYLWRIIGLTFFLTLFTLLVVLSITPSYTAKTSLLIEAQQANVLSIEEVYGLDSNRKEYFETQYQILRSRQIAERVVEKLELYNNPHFDPLVIKANKSSFEKFIENVKASIKSSLPFLPQEVRLAPSEEEILDARKLFASSRLMRATTIKPVRNTQVVEVFVESPDPKLSALLANAIADIYIESYLQAKLDMTEKATLWLNESLQGLRAKLDDAELNLADFYEEHQVVDIDGVVTLASEQVQELSEQLLDAQILLQRNRSIYEQINSHNISFDELATLPDVLNHPSIQAVNREQVLIQSRFSELREIYGPKHPNMIAVTAELNSIKSSLNLQISNLVSGINNEYRQAESKVTALSIDLEKAKDELRKLSSLDNRRKALQRDVDINQQLYDSFFTRLKETDQIGGFESANARVIDSANPPNTPSAPRKMLIVFIAMIFSFGFGCSMALLLESMNSGIRSVEDVERKLGQRMLGLIPWQPQKRNKDLPVKHFFDSNQRLFSESVRTLRTSLQLLKIDEPAKVTLVTSSVPKEGKSTVSVNLAFALGQLKNVLLIDSDLRRPSISRLFSLPGFQPGLANIVAGTHSLDECIYHDEESKLDVLVAGTLPSNPQELLASNKFAELITTLQDRYDHIIIDSAPTQAVSDSIVVSKYCDSLVYVVRADSTNVKTINKGLSRFLEIGHRIDGVVLNQVDLKKLKNKGDYSGFYDVYGYDSYVSNDKIS